MMCDLEIETEVIKQIGIAVRWQFKAPSLCGHLGIMQYYIYDNNIIGQFDQSCWGLL